MCMIKVWKFSIWGWRCCGSVYLQAKHWKTWSSGTLNSSSYSPQLFCGIRELIGAWEKRQRFLKCNLPTRVHICVEKFTALVLISCLLIIHCIELKKCKEDEVHEYLPWKLLPAGRNRTPNTISQHWPRQWLGAVSRCWPQIFMFHEVTTR